MKQKKHNAYPFSLALPALILYTVMIILPVAMSVALSFTDWNIRRWFEPVFNGVVNYIEVVQDEVFLVSVFNSLLFAISTTILKIAAGLALALALCKPFFGNSVFRTIYYVPCVISTTVIGVLFTAILGMNGLLNNVLTTMGLEVLTREWLGRYGTAMFWIILIEVWMWAGFNMFIFISGLQAIPKDYYEACEIEGATAWHKFYHITLPLLVPAITVNGTLNLAGGMKVFDIVYVLTNGGPGTDTQVLSTYVFRSFSFGMLGESSAANVILTFIVIILTFALNGYFRKREVEIG